MKSEYKDFIGVYTDVYPDGYCEHVIKEFERLACLGAGSDRKTTEGALKHRKDDFQIGLNFPFHSVEDFKNWPVTKTFFEGLQLCYEEYVEKYSVLQEPKIQATHMKLQRTDSGGGYHIWHCEQGNGDQASRVLAYMLYLNTLEPEENGETEFLYQQRRIRPEKNTMVIWPAAFTHVHRGNAVFGNNSKYIATGWFYYE